MALILAPKGKGIAYAPKSDAKIVNFVPLSQHVKILPTRSITKLYHVLLVKLGILHNTDGPPAA